MTTFYTISAVVLLLILLIGGVRVVIGPEHADRMMAVQLFGSCSVAILLLLFTVSRQPALLDIALVLALLSSITLIGFYLYIGARK